MRGVVAMGGVFGYELDLTKVSASEKKEIAVQVAHYKSIEETVLFGDLYRLQNPWVNQTFSAWMSVSKDRTEAIVNCVWILGEANSPRIVLCLKGLDAGMKYLVEELERSYGGDELMSVGISLPQGPAQENSVQYHLMKVD